MDVLNIGHLLSSDWGLIHQPNNIQPIGERVDGARILIYIFNTNQTETFRYDASLASRWQAQFSLPYIF